jgi:hypothetical protein
LGLPMRRKKRSRRWLKTTTLVERGHRFGFGA